MEIDVTAKRDDLHRLLTCLVSPRPIGWISTISSDGDVNLAPFSYFNAVSTDPPVVVFSTRVEDGEPKDTARNAMENGEFVCNLVTEPLAEQMDTTAAPLAADESEFEFAGLTRTNSTVVTPPRVAESAAHMECVLHDTLRIHDHILIFGDVVHVHVNDHLLTDGRIDMREVNAVGRLGGPFYTRVNLLDVKRQY